MREINFYNNKGLIDACDIRRVFSTGREEYTGVLLLDSNLSSDSVLPFRCYVDDNDKWQITNPDGNPLDSEVKNPLLKFLSTGAWMSSNRGLDYKDEIIDSVREYKAAVQDQINTLKSTPYNEKLPEGSANLLTKTQIFEARKDAINELIMDWWSDKSDLGQTGGFIGYDKNQELIVGMDNDGNIGASTDGREYCGEGPRFDLSFGAGCTIAAARLYNIIDLKYAVALAWETMTPMDRKEQLEEWWDKYDLYDEDHYYNRKPAKPVKKWNEAFDAGEFENDGRCGTWDGVCMWLRYYLFEGIKDQDVDGLKRFASDGLKRDASYIYGVCNDPEILRKSGGMEAITESEAGYSKVYYDANLKNGWRDPKRNTYGDNREHDPYKLAAYKPSDDSLIYSQQKEISR